MLLHNILNDYDIILGSQSPRRHYLLKELGLEFEVKVLNGIDESYPADMNIYEVPEYLARVKAKAYLSSLTDNSILITADTVVILENEILGKPADYKDAVEIINRLSDNKHTVVTGVAITSLVKQVVFNASTDVFFKKLLEEEISYYINQYKPFDKAGAYGIQEWIGYIGIEKIEGSYFNVMGLPIQKLYKELINFLT
jgi:septum formation protein